MMSEPADHRSVVDMLRSEGGLFNSSEILPYRGLFIGSALAARQPHFLAKISHVLSVNGQPPLALALLPAHLRCLTLDIDDDTEEDILQHLPRCFDAITAGRAATYAEPSGPNGVLVHCTLGISRSATICAAYIMCTSLIPASRALDIVRAARRWVRPNDGFLKQLQHLEGTLLRPAPPQPLADRTAVSDACDLCTLCRKTTWHAHTHPLFVVIDCDSCDVPMLVVRSVGRGHGATWPRLGPTLQAAALSELAGVADAQLGSGGWWPDWQMRSTPDHAHVHARPWPRSLPAPRL